MFVLPSRTKKRSAHRQYIDSFKKAPVKMMDGNICVDVETDQKTGLPLNLGPEFGIDILTAPAFGFEFEELKSKVESAKNAETQANKDKAFTVQTYMGDSLLVIRTA